MVADPFKEERVQVEAFTTIFGALGVSLAVGLIAVSYSYELAVLPGMRTYTYLRSLCLSAT